jgi:hypothetical protein
MAEGSESSPGADLPPHDGSLLEWAAVDLPAQLLIGGLKAGLLVHSAWNAWSEKRARKASNH